MDTPATPLKEVYQAFFDDLAKEDTKQSTIDRYRYNILRFEKWLSANDHPAILGSLERTIPSPTGNTSRRCPSSRAARHDLALSLGS